jgi:uncharacterized SAM-binding protein YcdF (DUF218 family)
MTREDASFLATWIAIRIFFILIGLVALGLPLMIPYAAFHYWGWAYALCSLPSLYAYRYTFSHGVHALFIGVTGCLPLA